MSDPAAPERHVKPFAEFLQQQQNGRTHAELSEALDELVTAVVGTGKGGTLTLKISVKPTGKGNTDVLQVADDVTVKLPTRDRPESIYFVDGEGHLSRKDPRQQELPLRDVSATATEPTTLKDAR